MHRTHLDQRSGAYATAHIDNRGKVADTPWSISRECGPVVYFIRTRDDLIKVGHTTHLDVRKGQLTDSWQNLLALRPGTLADEAELHDLFRPYLARGWEYYAPNMEILSFANEIRASYGIPPVEPWF